MIMHPAVPALNGKVLDSRVTKRSIDGLDGEKRKLDNKNLFVAFVDVVEKSGRGFVNYEWPKPKEGGGTTTELYTKLSYVQKFEPWGWVLGSGIYRRCQQDVDAVKWMLVSLNIIFAIFLMGLCYLIGRVRGIC
jgi:methyl-accepting chemotaxis protein